MSVYQSATQRHVYHRYYRRARQAYGEIAELCLNGAVVVTIIRARHYVRLRPAMVMLYYEALERRYSNERRYIRHYMLFLLPRRMVIATRMVTYRRHV